VVRDLAVMLADGGDCLADLRAVRDQQALFGPVASDATAFRLIDEIARDRALLDALRAARAAARELSRASTDTKNRALHASAAAIRGAAKGILDANAGDVRQARADGADGAFVDRLTLTPALIEQMARGVEEVAALADPVGEISERRKQPSGIEVARMRVPLGVIGIIYESRPNVTADAAALCIKAGNACILRGGSEALESNRAIADCVRAGLKSAGLPETAVQLVGTSDRATAPATPWKRCSSPRTSRRACCRASARSTLPKAWRCAPTRPRASGCPARSARWKRTTTRNGSRRLSRSAW
jgi:hypothetical protein